MNKNPMALDAHGAIPRTIRNYNRRVVLNAVREKQEFSVAEIASEVMLSRQSVMKAISYFIDKKIIIPLGKGSSTESGGKRPELYELRPYQKLIVILQRTDEMRFSLMDLSANLLDVVSISITKDLTDEGFLEAVVQGREKLLRDNPQYADQIYGVAMAMGGLVELKNQSLHRSMYFSNLSVGLPVYDMICRIFPEVSCVIIDNIGRMAGRSALFNQEIAGKSSRILTLYIDRAITGCFFVDGKIQDGDVQMMIEAGHMIVDPYDQEICTCGNCGCAENLIKLSRIRKNLKKSYPKIFSNGRPTDQIYHHDLFEGCKRGEYACVKEVERLAQVLGCLLRNVLLTCNPGMIVFMGNFADADGHFDKALKKYLQNDWVYCLRGGTFDIFYDRRELSLLETIGSAESIIKAFYNDDELYGKEEG